MALVLAKQGTSSQNMDSLERFFVRNELPLVFLDYQEDWATRVVSTIKESSSKIKKEAKIECNYCSLKLLTELGLEEHYQRRSIQVRLPCLKCCLVHICYNPCQVLNVLKLCQTVVPWGLTIEEVEPHIAGLPIKLREPDADAPTSGKFTAEELIHATRTCHECKVLCAEDTLERHMTFSTGLKLTCQFCGQRMPTRCSQQAHMRLHRLKPPFVCPECGKMAPRETKIEEFKHHVNELCHHRERLMVYQCPNCPAVQERDRDLASHIADSHVQVLHKCSHCSLAFKDTSAFISHSGKNHSFPGATPVSVIKCPMCEACVFADTQMLIQHFLSIHISSCSKFVFRCHICRQLRTDQLAIHEHHKAEHSWKPTFPDVMTVVAKTVLAMGADGLRHNEGKAAIQEMEKKEFSLGQGTLLHCLKCAFESMNRVQFLQHVRTHKEGETPHQCSDCGIYLEDEPALTRHLTDAHKLKDVAEHLKKISDLSKLIATQVDDQADDPKAVVLPAEPQQAMEESADNNDKIFKCAVCCKEFIEKRALELHMRTHGSEFLKSFNKQRRT